MAVELFFLLRGEGDFDRLLGRLLQSGRNIYIERAFLVQVDREDVELLQADRLMDGYGSKYACVNSHVTSSSRATRLSGKDSQT